jgi:hypothetical protein
MLAYRSVGMLIRLKQILAAERGTIAGQSRRCPHHHPSQRRPVRPVQFAKHLRDSQGNGCLLRFLFRPHPITRMIYLEKDNPVALDQEIECAIPQRQPVSDQLGRRDGGRGEFHVPDRNPVRREPQVRGGLLADLKSVHLPVDVVNPQLSVVFDIFLHDYRRTWPRPGPQFRGIHRDGEHPAEPPGCCLDKMLIHGLDEKAAIAEQVPRRGRIGRDHRPRYCYPAPLRHQQLLEQPRIPHPNSGRCQCGQLIGDRLPGIPEEHVIGRAIRAFDAARGKMPLPDDGRHYPAAIMANGTSA